MKETQPLVVLMQIEDVDAQPCMGLIAYAFEKVEANVSANFKNSKSDYEHIFTILDKKLDEHFQRPLFDVGALLNLEIFYKMDR